MPALIVMGLWIALMAATVAVSWRSRDPMLRRATITCAAGWLLTVLLEHAWPHWRGPHLGVLIVDASAAGVFAWIAVSDRTWWAIAACGFQLATVGVHLSYMLAPGYLRSAYYTGLTLLGFLVAFSVLAAGVGRLREGGYESD